MGLVPNLAHGGVDLFRHRMRGGLLDQSLLFTLNTSLGSQATPLAVAAAAAATTTASKPSSGSDPSPRLVPAIQPRGTTGRVVHHRHSSTVSARKRT
jgi:hypothetical protein